MVSNLCLHSTVTRLGTTQGSQPLSYKIYYPPRRPLLGLDLVVIEGERKEVCDDWFNTPVLAEDASDVLLYLVFVLLFHAPGPGSCPADRRDGRDSGRTYAFSPTTDLQVLHFPVEKKEEPRSVPKTSDWWKTEPRPR